MLHLGIDAAARRPGWVWLRRSNRAVAARMKAARGGEDLELSASLEAVARTRDIASFRVLFDHYAPRVKAYVRRLGVADDVAEDLAQEVMITVWHRAHQFDEAKASLGTWIFTIARNKRIDRLRRERVVDLDPEDPSFTATGPQRADEIVQRRELEAKLRQAVATLPPEQSDLLKIFYFEEKTHSTIAEELGLPLGTVKSRLRLALGKLRGLLGEHGR